MIYIRPAMRNHGNVVMQTLTSAISTNSHEPGMTTKFKASTGNTEPGQLHATVGDSTSGG